MNTHGSASNPTTEGRAVVARKSHSQDAPRATPRSRSTPRHRHPHTRWKIWSSRDKRCVPPCKASNIVGFWQIMDTLPPKCTNTHCCCNTCKEGTGCAPLPPSDEISPLETLGDVEKYPVLRTNARVPRECELRVAFDLRVVTHCSLTSAGGALGPSLLLIASCVPEAAWGEVPVRTCLSPTR
jgi:hypothetical protein